MGGVETDPKRTWARAVVAWAVREGVLVRGEDCERCGHVPEPHERPLDAHHWLGYEYHVALVVEWLCRSCHLLTHGGRSGPALRGWETRRARYGPSGSSVTREERSAASRLGWAANTPEQRAERGRRISEGRRTRSTPEQRSEVARRREAAKRERRRVLRSSP